jgi:cold shock CspA family protein
MSSARGGPRRPRTGTVTAMDDLRGVGTVTASDGESFFFHCTAVADGSRHIEVGTKVVFVAAPGHLGRFEARHLAALGADA